MIISSNVQETDTLSLYYFFFPLFEMLSLALCDEGVLVRLSTLYTSNSMKLSISAVFIHSVLLSTLSHWLYDISSISNSANLFLMNFSRPGYPGTFLQQCTKHSTLVLFSKRISLIRCSHEDYTIIIVTICFRYFRTRCPVNQEK